MERKACYTIFLFSWLSLSGCTYNPMSNSNDLTGSATGAAVGAGIGAGTTALLRAPGVVVGLAGLGGAGIGYYVTSLRYSSSGIVQAGGQVFTLGDYVTIEVPTDNLFDSNSAEFLPNTQPILDSIADVLQRYPNNNVVVSGNSSGFSSERYEQKLSEDRARQIAGSLWANGINNFQGTDIHMRRLLYVGYGNYFPVANNITATGIRQNSRIQITSFPTYAHMNLGKCHVFNNMGAIDEPPLMTKRRPCDINSAFEADTLPEGTDSPRVPPIQPERNYIKESANFKDDESWGNYNSITSSSQTSEGVNVPKQTGFKGEGGFKDEGSR